MHDITVRIVIETDDMEFTTRVSGDVSSDESLSDLVDIAASRAVSAVAFDLDLIDGSL